jgi:hypothetical protein
VLLTAVQRWAADLAEWRLPDEILAAAPQSPWIHPVALFEADDGATDRSRRSAAAITPSTGTPIAWIRLMLMSGDQQAQGIGDHLSAAPSASSDHSFRHEHLDGTPHCVDGYRHPARARSLYTEIESGEVNQLQELITPSRAQVWELC